MKDEIQKVIQAVETLAGPALEAEGFDLIEVQYRRERGGWVLRLFVDRAFETEPSAGVQTPGSGVTLDDCVTISKEIGRLLEAHDVIPGPYNLEVSSPGLDRPLKKLADFVHFTGRLVRVKTKSPVNGQRKIKGRLLGLENGLIKLEVNGQAFEVRLDETEGVVLEPEVNWGRA